MASFTDTKCSHCSKNFLDNVRCANHEYDKHGVQGQTDCTLCGKSFKYWYSVLQHMKDKDHTRVTVRRLRGNSHTNTLRTIPCLTCDKKFCTNAALDQHKRAKNHDQNSALDQHKRAKNHDQNSVQSCAKEINESARAFHDHYARPPGKDSDYKVFTEVTDQLLYAMKDAGLASKRVCVGSASERTNIRYGSDYDVLFPLQTSKYQARSENNKVKIMQNGEPLDPVVFLRERKSKIQKICNTWSDSGARLGSHGPAITLTMTKPNTSIDIDVVPALELQDGKTYVSKGGQWRVSHSQESRDRFKVIDVGNSCNREAYRTCKAIKTNIPSLSSISTYHLKCVILRTSGGRNWPRESLGDRVVDVLRHTMEAYRKKRLYDYFDSSINLLKTVDPDTLENTANRIENLMKRPHDLFKID